MPSTVFNPPFTFDFDSVCFRFRPSRNSWRETAESSPQMCLGNGASAPEQGQELSNEEVRTFQNNEKKRGVEMHRVWKAASVRSRTVPKQVHPKHPTAATVGRRRHGQSQNTRKTGGPLTTRRLSEHVALLLSEKAGQHEHTHTRTSHAGTNKRARTSTDAHRGRRRGHVDSVSLPLKHNGTRQEKTPH